jgi:hypothetical protein
MPATIMESIVNIGRKKHGPSQERMVFLERLYGDKAN